MPISTPPEWVEKYNNDNDHFVHVLDALFVPAVQEAGYEAIRPIAEGNDNIHASIIQKLEESEMVLCDMSTLNANVFFELGVRTALNRPVASVHDGLIPATPFDVSGINFNKYNPGLEGWRITEDKTALSVHIRKAGEGCIWN